jgi:hypothetical protein
LDLRRTVLDILGAVGALSREGETRIHIYEIVAPTVHHSTTKVMFIDIGIYMCDVIALLPSAGPPSAPRAEKVKPPLFR